MRSRFVGLMGGRIQKDSCRGDGGGRSIHAKIGTLYKVLIPDMTSIDADRRDTNYGNESLTRISWATGWVLWGLVKADLSAYAGMTVVAATVNLYHVGGYPAKDFSAYEVKKVWEELQVTYNDRVTGEAWEEPGCKGASDRFQDPCDVISVGVRAWYSWDVSGPVVAWLAGIRTNYGLLIRPWEFSGAANQWYSDDYEVDPTLKPYFELTLA